KIFRKNHLQLRVFLSLARNGMSNKHGKELELTMARLPRLTLPHQDTFYHLISRVCGPLDWYPFHDPVVAEAFLRILFHYAHVYCCQLADYTCSAITST